MVAVCKSKEFHLKSTQCTSNRDVVGRALDVTVCLLAFHTRPSSRLSVQKYCGRCEFRIPCECTLFRAFLHRCGVGGGRDGAERGGAPRVGRGCEAAAAIPARGRQPTHQGGNSLTTSLLRTCAYPQCHGCVPFFLFCLDCDCSVFFAVAVSCSVGVDLSTGSIEFLSPIQWAGSHAS